MNQTVPHGAWPSALQATDLAAGAVRRSEARVHDGFIYWVEGRPAQGGRSVIVRHDPKTGASVDIGPDDLDVRTLVHEYGGGAWLPTSAGLLAVHLDDQQIWLHPGNGEHAVAITSEGPEPRSHRYADPVEDPHGGAVIWVAERHEHGMVDNLLVSVEGDGTVTTVASGHDFYSSPAVSPDGDRLAFVTWDHPNMPWDHTLIQVCERVDGRWSSPRTVVDGPALQQPRWSPDGRLHLISDATGWWTIHEVDPTESDTVPLVDLPAEFGLPAWVFANQTYDWCPDGSIWCSWVAGGVGHLGIISEGRLHEIDSGFTEFGRLEALPDGRVATIAASWTRSAAAVIIDRDGRTQELSTREPTPLTDADISVPEAIDFAGADGLETHGLYFPPVNGHVTPPEGELPPLLVVGHGGPTGAARSSLDLGIQYWTSRGIAVVDVNYGGSTGFGTPYRERLRGSWGITDAQDCTAAALYLASSDRADLARLAIKGGSAGGYTTLCALMAGPTFAAGISRYGVADLTSLATDTHKFESRYLDSLVGPWPEARNVYQERSPINHPERLATPMLVLQGSEDPVVPPSQSEALVAALAAADVPHAYVLFDGESHGFRQAGHIARALECELSFLGQVFGFEPADAITRVELRSDQ